MREAVPQSLRQQELVCLTSGHINCPRYLRGAVVVTDLPTPIVRVGSGDPARGPRVDPGPDRLVQRIGRLRRRPRRHRSPDRGRQPAQRPSPSATAVAVVAGRGRPRRLRPRRPSTPCPACRRRRSPTPTPSPTPSPTPTPDADADPTPSPRPKPTAKPTKAPTSNRYPLLDPVPEQAGLLHLHRPERGQPVQHRELLRHPTRDRPSPQPVDRDPPPQGRPGAHPPATPTLTARGLTGSAGWHRRPPVGPRSDTRPRARPRRPRRLGLANATGGPTADRRRPVTRPVSGQRRSDRRPFHRRER